MSTQTLEQTLAAIESHMELYSVAVELGKDLEVGLESASDADIKLNALAARLDFPIKLTLGFEAEKVINPEAEPKEDSKPAKESILKRIVAFIKKVLEWLAKAFNDVVNYLDEATTNKQKRITKTRELLKKPIADLIEEPKELKGSLLSVDGKDMSVNLACIVEDGEDSVSTQHSLKQDCPFVVFDIAKIIADYEQASSSVKASTFWERTLSGEMNASIEPTLFVSKDILDFRKRVVGADIKRSGFGVSSSTLADIEKALSGAEESLKELGTLKKCQTNFQNASIVFNRSFDFSNQAAKTREFLRDMIDTASKLIKVIKLA